MKALNALKKPTLYILVAALSIVGQISVNLFEERVNRSIERSNNENIFVELHPGSYENKISICTLEYNILNQVRRFSGTNYYNDGREFGKWESISIMEYKDNSIKYIQESFRNDSMYETREGMGRIVLNERRSPILGYFRIEGVTYRNVVYLPLDFVERQLNYSIEQNNKHSTKIFIEKVATNFDSLCTENECDYAQAIR